MNNMKKKIFVIAMVVCILVLSATSATLSYFTDTKEKDNTFTVGEVSIILDADISTDMALYPTLVINKGATVSLTDASEPAYVGAIVKISSDHDLTGLFVNENGELDPTIITGINSDCTIVKTVKDGEDILVYLVASTKLDENNTSIQLFSSITIPGEWNNDQMDLLKDELHVTVYAYAVQSAGLEGDALAALQAGFDAFDHIN